jgi:hypothetical protein
VGKSKSQVVSKHTKLTVSGFLDVEKFRTYTGLGHVSAGVDGAYVYRVSSEFGSPTVGVFARFVRDEYESQLRDGMRFTSGINFRQTLTDRIRLFAAAENNVRTGRSDVFNTHDVSGRFNLDYGVMQGQTFYLTGEMRKGDIVSSGLSALKVVDIATVFVRDDVFVSPQFFSYRMKGKTGLWTLGYNYSFGNKDSVDFSWRHVKSTTDKAATFAAPISYVDNLFSVSYLMAF